MKLLTILLAVYITLPIILTLLSFTTNKITHYGKKHKSKLYAEDIIKNRK